MVDTDAQNGRGWWHWSVFNIPASVHRLAAGAGSEGSKDLPAGAIQGRTDFGFSHYAGPCPPIGDHVHHYEITIYTRSRSHRCRSTKPPRAPRSGPASGPTHWQRRRSSDATAVRSNTGSLKRPAPRAGPPCGWPRCAA
jgi:hypothetical protein